MVAAPPVQSFDVRRRASRDQPPGRRDQPLPAAARRQPGRLVGVGRRRRSPRRGARDVPVLLSVGYAACHWCHVMAHESFEDDGDRGPDERRTSSASRSTARSGPDVDSVYMAATQAMTGHGGWPMTVFPTPDGEPFYCGTYFPPRPAHGMPAFRQVLAAVADAWPSAAPSCEAAGTRIVERHLRPAGPGRAGAADRRGARRRRRALADGFDEAAGGFGGAPKFPPSMVLEFLLRHARPHRRRRAAAHGARAPSRRWPAAASTTSWPAASPATPSTPAGWCRTSRRCSTTTRCCCGSTCTCGARPARRWARRVADETADFLLRDLRHARGRVRLGARRRHRRASRASPTSGRRTQLVEVLGPDDGRWAAELFEVTDAGTFEHGTSTLQLLRDPDDAGAAGRRCGERLLAARARRPQPARDDKVVTAWNGLAIAALAEPGVAHRRRPASVAAAAAGRRPARAARTGSTAGCAGPPATASSAAHAGVLEDYGDLAEGLLALHQATADGRWLELAGDLLDVVAEQFVDDRAAGTTPPPTPRRWCTGPFDPGRRADARRGRGRGRGAASPTPRSPARRGTASWARRRCRVARAAGGPGAARRRLGGRGRGGAARRPAGGGGERPGGAASGTRSRPPRGRRPAPAPSSWWASRTRPASRCWPTGRWSAGRPPPYVCRGFVCSAPVTDVSALSAAMTSS